MAVERVYVHRRFRLDRGVLHSVAMLVAFISAPAYSNQTSDNQSDMAIASCQHLLETGAPSWTPLSSDLTDTALPNSLGGITREAYQNLRGQQGTKISGTLADGEEITWTTIEVDETVQAVLISTAHESLPRAMWQFNDQCQPTQHRQLIYNEEMQATELRVFNTDDGTLSISEPLNPPVPRRTELRDTNQPRVRVAMVDSGVNYTLPEINNRLARDPDGDLIGFDFWDNDALPFDSHFGQSAFHVIRHGTGTASLLLKESPYAELVAYRYPRPDMTRMTALIQHAAANRVRIIGLPLGGNKADQWEAFANEARQHPDMLFIASAGNNGRNIDENPVYPAALDLPNLLVVTSADDFVVPAERVNWGRTHVDYFLPAEQQKILNFFGQEAIASGSSYAVPRAMGMAVRWLIENPSWGAKELIAEFARRFSDGMSSRYVGGGYIADPLADDNMSVELIGVQTLTREKPLSDDPEEHVFKLPLSVFVLHDGWTNEQISQSLLQAEELLSQCKIAFNSVTITALAVPDYLRDLETGSARTLTGALQNDSEFKPIKVFYARDTLMARPTDGASFGDGNTRRRPWLKDSVWLMENIEDPGIALAHELFHVLANNGGHSRMANNLMQSRTSPDNIKLLESQCTAAIDNAKNNRLLFD